MRLEGNAGSQIATGSNKSLLGGGGAPFEDMLVDGADEELLL